MKGQDIIIALQLVASPPETRLRPTKWLADDLGMSTSTVHEALDRLYQTRIIRRRDNAPMAAFLSEFLEHGIRYVFPPILGAITRGIPTAVSAPPLDAVFPASGNESAFVWPYSKGTVRGTALTPIYANSPRIAVANEQMHQLMAITDALRLDDPRIRREASLALRAALASEPDGP